MVKLKDNFMLKLWLRCIEDILGNILWT